MTTHHPADDILVEYSAGSLNMVRALSIAAHLHFCARCRMQVENFNKVGGMLLENCPPAKLDEAEFSALMRRLEQESKSKPERKRPKARAATYRNPLDMFLPKKLGQLKWRKQTNAISDYDLKDIINEPGYRVALQKINKAGKVPRHTHRGHEYTVVLMGGFSDEMGVYDKGDFIALDGRHKHTPISLEEDCICLTILDAPVRFVGVLSLLNPFIRWK